MLNFQPIRLEDRPLFQQYLHQPGMYGCDNSFVTNYLWQEAYHVEYAVCQGALLTRGGHWATEQYFGMPLGVTETNCRQVAEALLEAGNGQLIIDGLYENQIPVVRQLFPQAELVENPDESDYIYLQSDLAIFAGRRFHGQKNHLNAFYKAHPDAVYEAIDRSNSEECLDFALQWCEERSAKDVTILDEQVALKKAFLHFDELGLRGGAIRFEGRIQAMSVGDKYLDDIADVHFEKANKAVRGLYVAMCQGFAAHAWSDVKYLNREEDMGLAGLRKAKQDLHPVMIWKRYNAVIK